jgi:hypothetical protein
MTLKYNENEVKYIDFKNLAYNISLINYFNKTFAKTTIYTICCFKNVGVPGTPQINHVIFNVK